MIPGIVQNIILQTGNGKNLLSWSILAGATSYLIQRSIDGVNFTTVGSSLTNSFTDSAVLVGVNYFYQVSGFSNAPSNAVATLTFSGQPNATDSVTIANVVFTAVASGATGDQFNIGSTVATTISNLANVIKIALVNVVVPSSTATVLTLTSFVYGPEGNGLQLSNALTNVTSTAFSNGANGSASVFMPSYPLSITPCLPGQINLGYLRYMSQLRADKLNSDYLTTDEWNWNINQSANELYDIMVDKYGEDYFFAPALLISLTGANFYPIPDGSNYPINGVNSPALYKLNGIDANVSGAALGPNAGWIPLARANWSDRDRFTTWPGQAGALNNIYQMSYRQMGDNIFLFPANTNMLIQIWYVPILSQMLTDTDMLPFSISGWSEFVIVDAAMKAMIKEESLEKWNALAAMKSALIERIEVTASNRDVGQPNTVSNVRATMGDPGFSSWGNGYGGGGFGGSGGGY